MHLGTQYCTPREIRHCLFNAALRALLNRQWLISRVVQYSCLMHSHLINYSFINTVTGECIFGAIIIVLGDWTSSRRLGWESFCVGHRNTMVLRSGLGRGKDDNNEDSSCLLLS